MRNPNYKISETKILLKNTNKKLDKKFFIELMKWILQEDLKKKANTVKVF